jgi:hypothetical protein
MGSSVEWSFSIQGNGLAASGVVEIRFLIEDGAFFDWNTSLEAISGAIPEVSFHEVVFVEGTNINSSANPLGLGPHPVNNAFDMGWKIENAGTSIWEPVASLELPSDDWVSSCSVNPIRISPGGSAMVWCSITIPLSQEAGSEPEISLVMAADGVEVRETLTLLVDTVKEVEWTLINFSEAREDYPTNLYLELHNTGNVAISNRIVTDGPDDWNIRIVDGILVTLQPGEGRSVQVEFTPDSGSDGSLKIMLANAEDISGQSRTLEIEVISESSGGGRGPILYVLGATMLVLIASISAALAYARNGGDISSLIPGRPSSGRRKEYTPFPPSEEREPTDEPVEEDEPATSEKRELQRFPDHPGWLWDPSDEEWVADPEYDHGDQ